MMMYPKRVKIEDWSDKQATDDRLTPYNWLFIQTAQVPLKGEETELNIPRRCMHCANPPCVKLCPWGAARQFDNGISQIDSGLCMGGQVPHGLSMENSPTPNRRGPLPGPHASSRRKRRDV